MNMIGKTLTLFTFIFLCISAAHSQSDIKIYLDSRMEKQDREAVAEMAGIIEKNSHLDFSYDSSHRFAGKGIYITTVANDYYKKAPAEIRLMGPEAIYIKADKDYIYIAGNSSLAVREGLFLYLDNLGFRYFFPDPLWHVTPQLTSIFKEIDLLTEPDYKYRYISMGWGEGSEKLGREHLFWIRANRMRGSFEINNGHSYAAMIMENRQEFEKNPQYLTKPLLNGKPQPGTAFNYSSDGLADLAYRWLANKFDRSELSGKPLQMLSLEPFDGNTFCNLPACKSIGLNSSDQIMYFTNKVAKKLRLSHPGKLIGILAYNDHIDIPKYKVEDNIFITLTNGFNNSGYTTNELINRWGTKVKSMGIYDYMSVYSWDFDLPGRGLAANYKKVVANLNNYKKRGIKTYIAESTYGWVNKGLGHYIASKILWNANVSVNTLVNEFFDSMFPQSKKYIRQLYESWLLSSNQYPLDEELYSWYMLLRRAFSDCNNEAELKRLGQIGKYLEYVRLVQQFKLSSNANVRENGLNLFSYMWQIFDDGITPSYAALSELPGQWGKDFSISNKNAVWKQSKIEIPEGKNSWIDRIDSRVSSFKRMNNYIPYSEASKIPVKFLEQISKKTSGSSNSRELTFHTRAKFILDLKQSDSLYLKLTVGGVSATGQAKIKIYNWNESMELKGLPVKTFFVEADKKQVTLDLKVLRRKKYIIYYEDNGNGCRMYFPDKLKINMIASADNPFIGGGGNSFYFFVPPGVSRFYIVKSGYLKINRPGPKGSNHDSNENVVEITVNKDESGWWIGSLQLNNFYFVGIPPFITSAPANYIFLK